ncbi:MAG: MFS transporter [Pseudomonadota bacterium]
MAQNSHSGSNAVRKLSLPTMAAFGFGQTAEGVKNQAFNVFLLFYYQQVIGIPGTWAGAALAIAMLFDAVTDPVAGIVSDRFKSRWGRRHPFMIVSVFPLVLCFVALFSPPDGLSELANFLWLTFFAILVRGSLTFFYVPHLSLGAEIAQDYNQRSTLFAFSTVFSITAMALVSILGFRYFFPTTELYNPGTLNPDGYTPFAMFFAGLMFIAIIGCSWGTRKEIPHMDLERPSQPLSLESSLGDFKAVFGNKSFRLILFGMLMTTFAIAVEAVMSPFMGVHFWGLRTEQLGLISIGTLLGLWIGLPLAPKITARLDKKYALVFPAIFVAINANAALCMRLFDVSWFPDNDSPWVFWIYFMRYLLQGICLPVILASFNSMFADISDEVELETGVRREGIIYASRSFANKVTSAMGAFLGGVALDVIAFPKAAAVGSVSADTIWWLGFLEGPATTLISLTGVLFYLRYQIDRDRHAEIRAAIAQRDKDRLSHQS